MSAPAHRAWRLDVCRCSCDLGLPRPMGQMHQPKCKKQGRKAIGMGKQEGEAGGIEDHNGN